MAIDNFNYYAYVLDDGTTTYNIVLHVSTASILGISPVNVDANPPWPYKHKDLRHITGRDAAGTVRRRLTIPTTTNSLYAPLSGVSWVDKEGNTILREGKFGSKEPRKG
jgi:hypothetical protein